ncbi:dTDP-glucose 4,6-dehydratase [Actinoplanes sp. URMC 104]|uniref:dTDP-glucose 4,6-dehydratase n=1 Tax=Actinoplanes sp. URMC 104 TaxID=3423409 RepID=UPI003F1C6980
MNLLVTGGAGFAGSHFVRAVLGGTLPGLQGARVTVLDKLTYAGSFDNLAEVAENERLDFVPGDVADAALVGVVMRRHDAVVHFAAEEHADASVLAVSNLLGTQTLLDAARYGGLVRFVQISTGEVYGPAASGAATERSPLSPVTPYAATKAGADLLALAAHRSHGVPVTILRAVTTYGPHQHPEKLLPRFVTRLLTGRTLPLHGDGGQVRDWLHVHDLTRAVALTLTAGRPGEVYHAGGSLELSNRDLAGLVLAECGAGWDRVEQVADRPGHDQRYALDDDKIREELGWHPRVEFSSGLTATVRWYREHPDRWQPLL